MPSTNQKKTLHRMEDVGLIDGAPPQVLVEDSVSAGQQYAENTIPAKLLYVCEEYPDKAALLYKSDHTFGYITYKRLLNLVENFTLSLETLGVKKDDRVVIISENRPEWAVADLSVKSLGAILVPIHKTFTAEQMQEVISEIEPSLFIVSDTAILSKIQKVKESLNSNAQVICFDPYPTNNTSIADHTYDFISALKLLPHSSYGDIYKRKIRDIDPHATAMIIYTPSANGKYIGVQLTHYNFVSNVENVKKYVDINKQDRLLSVLPLSHAFETTAGYYLPLFYGATVAYLNDLSELHKMLQHFKPTVIMGVPRLYEKISKQILNGIKKSKQSELFFNKAVSSSKAQTKRPTVSRFIYDRLVFKKIRDGLGGKLRFLISGGAALKPDISIFFQSIGIPILEGYGLTEASPIVSVNTLNDNRIGTVGRPLPNIDVKIAEDGEILIRGSSISPGYFRNDDANKRSFVDGWLRTGDLGELDEDGFLKIIGKKKDIIVLSTGKNISPRAIELRLEKSKYIDKAFVVGDGRKSIAALIVPNLKLLAERFPTLDISAMTKSKEVKLFVQNEIHKLLKDLSRHEQINNLLLINPYSSTNGGMPTINDVLDRHAIISKYRKEIDRKFNS